MNIVVDLDYSIKDGTEVVFRSPVDCSQVTGLKVYYQEDGNTVFKEFAFADAHGNNVGDIDHLFAENAVVKVILDVTTGMAFVQNADTNAYIERTFVKTVNGISPDKNGNVNVDVPGGGSGGGITADEVQSMIDGTVSAYTGVNVLYEYKQNADYQETAEVDEDGYYCCYVKISSDIPEASSFVGKTVRCIKDHKGYTHDNSYVVTEDEIIQDMNGVYCIGDLWDVIVVLNNESEFASDGLTVGVWHISKIKYDSVDETTIWLQVVEPHVTSKDVQTMINNSLGVIENGTY